MDSNYGDYLVFGWDSLLLIIPATPPSGGAVTPNGTNGANGTNGTTNATVGMLVLVEPLCLVHHLDPYFFFLFSFAFLSVFGHR